MTTVLRTRVHARCAPVIYPVLPSGWQRDRFIHLVERVASSLGLGRASVHTWTRLAAMTRPGDWTMEDREPFVYAAASELAKILGVSEPRLRSQTATLEHAGLLERRTAANGSRSLHAGTGLYFSGIIARLAELAALDEQLTAERHHAMHLRGQRSTHRRFLREALGRLREIAPTDPRIQEIATAFDAWPRADRLHGMTLNDLIRHVAEADALTRTALDLLETVSDTSGQPREIERSLLQDTTEDPFVSCDARDHQGGLHIAAHDPDDLPPAGTRQDAEKQGEATKATARYEHLTRLGPERLYHLASSEMQFYLSGRAAPQRLRFHDFIWAAEQRLPELDIHPSAWTGACARMGTERATVAMLILDARRSDSRTPIISAGGYLRGMTRACEQGRLNLMGSLIGLSQRRQGEHVP